MSNKQIIQIINIVIYISETENKMHNNDSYLQQ